MKHVSWRHPWWAWIGLAVVTGTATHLLRPDPLPWIDPGWHHRVETLLRELDIRPITRAELNEALAARPLVLLDARAEDDYDRGHIPGALSFSAADPETSFRGPLGYQQWLRPEMEIVVYCSDAQCDDAVVAAAFLRDAGFLTVRVYPGGIADWRESGLPLEDAP